ncbi:tetratricopeptide repeat protein [Pseudomonas asuensis]
MRFGLEDPRRLARLLLQGAGRGVPEAQARLGQILLDGNGIQRDQRLALHWFRIAARNGHVEAMNMVGRCLENGWGCKVDLPAAAQAYAQAARQGLDWGMYNYANLLTQGRGVPRNRTAALSLYRQAARQGHAKSMNLVGRFYEEGWEVPVDMEEAARWYLSSAQAGDFRGQCSHAALLARQGRVDEAVLWLRQAMRTATPGFLQKIAEALAVSDITPLRALAAEIHNHCVRMMSAQSSASRGVADPSLPPALRSDS